MEKRRIRLEINGVVCGLITQETEEYMQSLAGEVGEMMQAITNSAPFITREAAALTVALSYCDDMKKKERKVQELQEHVDELEVEAELRQEEQAAQDPALNEKLAELERRNTLLEEAAAGAAELKEKNLRLEDENAALRQTAKNAPGTDQSELTQRLEQLTRENTRLKAEAEKADLEKRQMKEAAEKAEQEKQVLKAAAEKARQERQKAERAAGSGTEKPETPPVPESKTEPEKPKTAKKRRNPMRPEEEFEQQGFVSFFEKTES